jgi:pimeloyl-ACP methyl ester carboxylesterase
LSSPRCSPWRIGRWALTAVVALVLILLVSIPIAVGVAQTRKPGQTIPDSAFSIPHETVTLHTRDGLDLAGWYVPSKNRAAIVIVHGGGGDRRGSRRHAEMLARHGYGVLLYDARGRGGSQGSPNAAGWTWQADVDAALEFLSHRNDVDPSRIGGLGLSTGADVLLEAAAKDPRLKAVVLDGSTARSLGDVRHLSLSDQIMGLPYWAVAYGTMAVLDQSFPGEPLIDLARKIAPKPALFIASNDLIEPVVAPKYAAAYGKPGALWRVDAGHTKGLQEHPQEYEQRVTTFFDKALKLGGHSQ